MNLQAVGRAIAERRREAGLTLASLAAQAGVGRSTLAALESGKLRELGLGRVARLCEAVGLVLDVRPMALEATEVEIAKGRRLSLPTVEEMLRIKAFLIVERNATRDYLDVAALLNASKICMRILPAKTVAS